uniref:Serpin domain-containing protein n=1 Tax=Panagrolaimus sp. JU765 TaxID=591449 RepID=A0AC34RAG4_9BILA
MNFLRKNCPKCFKGQEDDRKSLDSESGYNPIVFEGSSKIFLESQCEFVLEKLKEKETIENLIFSPISLFFSLETIFLGSKNETAKQIQNLLGKDLSEEEIHEYFSNIWSDLKIAKDLTIFPVLKVFLSKKHEFLESYKQKMDKYYQGTLENVDFDNLGKVVAKINKQVYDATEGNIDKVVETNDFGNEERITLANSLFFEANWLTDYFDTLSTKKDVDFFVNPDKIVKADFLANDTDFIYGSFENLQICALPLKNKQFFMYFVLPRKRFGLFEMFQELNKEKLAEIFAIEKEIHIYLRIPKFKIEMDVQLTENLKQMGISDVFDREKCDVSQISAEPNLNVDDIRQKCFIMINEEGVKAGAITLSDIRGAGLYSDPMPFFTADHPFAYFIVEKLQSNRCNILFAGIVAEPISGNDTIGRIVTESQVKFGVDFCKTCDFTKNAIFAPFPLFLNLATVGIGADDEAAKNILGFLANDDSKPVDIHKHLRHEMKPSEYECYRGKVEVFQQIFADKNFEIDGNFTESVKRYYSDVVKPIDFSNESEVETNVSEFFNNSLKTDVSEQFQHDPTTNLILANTVFFRVRWCLQVIDDGISDFFIDEQTKKLVEMINFTDGFLHEKTEDFCYFSLELDDDRTYLNIILPNKKFDLENVIKNLDWSNLMQLFLNRKYNSEFMLRIPKFKLESILDIIDKANNFKIPGIFDENCFGKVFSAENVKNLKILQKVQFDVNKHGIGNAEERKPYGNFPKKEILKVNHPFAFFVVKKPEFSQYVRKEYAVQVENFQLLLSGIVIDPTINL